MKDCKICNLKKKTEFFIPGTIGTDNIAVVGKVACPVIKKTRQKYFIIEDKDPHGGDLCVLCFWKNHKLANSDKSLDLIRLVAGPIVKNVIAPSRNLEIKKIDTILRSEKRHPHIQFILRSSV